MNALAMATKDGAEALPATAAVVAGLALWLAMQGGADGSVPSDLRRPIDDALFDSSSAAAEAL